MSDAEQRGRFLVDLVSAHDGQVRFDHWVQQALYHPFSDLIRWAAPLGWDCRNMPLPEFLEEYADPAPPEMKEAAGAFRVAEIVPPGSSEAQTSDPRLGYQPGKW